MNLLEDTLDSTLIKVAQIENTFKEISLKFCEPDICLDSITLCTWVSHDINWRMQDLKNIFWNLGMFLAKKAKFFETEMSHNDLKQYLKLFFF